MYIYIYVHASKSFIGKSLCGVCPNLVGLVGSWEGVPSEAKMPHPTSRILCGLDSKKLSNNGFKSLSSAEQWAEHTSRFSLYWRKKCKKMQN